MPLVCTRALTPSQPLDIAQGYCLWSRTVCEAFRGMNAALDAAFDANMAGVVTDAAGRSLPAIPDGDPDALLEQYYQKMALKK